jgi:DAACS family dicarboxylate/amino acid:cation (Na+ or H+) symporter
MTIDEPKPKGWYRGTPLYLRILIGLVLGVLAGLWFGPAAKDLAIPAKLVLRLLGALAPGLILVAIIHVLLTAQIERRSAGRLIFLLVLNTLVAIGIGLLVANAVKPGAWHGAPALPAGDPHLPKADSVVTQILDNIPKSLLGPLTDDGKVIGVIFIALAFGLALRSMPVEKTRPVAGLVEVLLPAFIKIVHWIIELVPIAVFGLVAAIIGDKGFGAFKALGAFVVAVIFALALQALYYLTRIRFGSWVRPWHLLKNTRDALVMAFSTGSSTATMPLTFQCLRERVGLREKSASLGALVGANFNNDGTALYEAMSALFVSQMLVVAGVVEPLTPTQQLLVVITSVFASVGAAGIPEAGLVTMTLVFKAVGLPVEYIALLLPVDWFLDRCRTCINVMGDMNVACLLDGRERASVSDP